MNIVVDELTFLHPSMLSLANGIYNDSNVVPLPWDYSPSEYDVICERGKDYYEHAGNKYFRACVNENIENYMNAKSRQVKASIVKEILDSVQNQSEETTCGFVKKDLLSRRWYRVSEKEAKDKIGQALRDAIKNVRARCRSERKESSPIETVHENAAVATVEAQSKPKAYQVGDDETNKAYDHPSSGTPNDLSSLLEGICASNEGKRQVSLLDKLFDHSMSLSSLDERSTSCPELFPPGKWGKTDLSPLNVGATQKPHHQRGSGLSAALAMMGQLEQSASSPCLNSSNWKKRALPSAVNGGWTSDIAPIDVHTKRGLVVPEDQPCKRRRQFVLGAICESTVSTGNEERAQPNRRSSGFLESLLGTSPLDLPGPASQEVSVLPRDLSNYLAQGPKSHQGYQKNDETMFAPSYPAIWKMGSPPKYINQTSTSFSCQEDNQSSTRRYSLTSRVATEFGLLDSCSSGLEQVSGNNRDAISQLLSDLEPTPISYPTTNPAADHARSA